MGAGNVELIWYGLCLIKAAILLVAFLPAALLCKWLQRRISRKHVKPRPVRHAIVHSLGTLWRPRHFSASQLENVDRSRVERRERIE
jgi:hypothetical protein